MSERGTLLVIGGGIGGYTAAIRAARQGLRVTLLECTELGGTCLNIGCIPTKSLLHQSKVWREWGPGSGGPFLRLNDEALCSVMDKKNRAVRQLVEGVRTLLRTNEVSYVQGTAEFIGPRCVRVRETGTELLADHVIIATGSEPVMPAIPGHDFEGVIDSEQALALTTLPERLLIIGGGVIGLEFAQLFSDFGSQVTVVEKQSRPLSEEDAEAAEVVRSQLARRGVEFALGTTVQEISREESRLRVRIASAQTDTAMHADLVLIATGRRARTRGLGLELAGIELDDGFIRTDDRCATSAHAVFAVGDVRGGPLLAHKASAEAECAVANILGQQASMSGRVLPRAVYTSPEVASAGLTEEQARESIADLRVGRFPFSASGRAITNEATTGFVKVLADGQTEQIVGICMAGDDVSNLLGEATLAVQMELTLSGLMETVHAHPTLTEALMEAAYEAHGAGAIHLPPRGRRVRDAK